jgi:hypothetical protein
MMRKKPNLEAFREGSSDSPIKVKEEQTIKVPTNDRISKTIRLSKNLETQIKMASFHRTMRGEKISESDIIEEALTQYFLKKS